MLNLYTTAGYLGAAGVEGQEHEMDLSPDEDAVLDVDQKAAQEGRAKRN